MSHGHATAATHADAARPVGEVAAALFRAQADAAREAAARVVASATPAKGSKKKKLEAAKPAGDDADPADTAIHDLRVALRRLRSLLRPARPLFGDKRVRALEAEIKAVADATGALRDEEVLGETLAALDLAGPEADELRTWLARRVRTERELRGAAVAKLKRDAAPHAAALANAGEPSLRRALVDLEALLVREPKKKRRAALEAPLAVFARASLELARAGVRDDVPAPDPADGESLHTLRIRYKRLRYVAEAFGGALGDRARSLAKSAEKMQKRLGHVHDLDVAIVRMRKAWGLPQAARSATLRALEEAREKSARRALRDHVEEGAKLDAEFAALGDGLEALLAAATAPTPKPAPPALAPAPKPRRTAPATSTSTSTTPKRAARKAAAPPAAQPARARTRGARKPTPNGTAELPGFDGVALASGAPREGDARAARPASPAQADVEPSPTE